MTQPYHLLPRVGSSLAEEWLDVGLNHHVAGRYAEAEQAYLKGLRVDPNNVRILTNLGVMAAQRFGTVVNLKLGDVAMSLPQEQMTRSLQYLERATLFEGDDACMSVVWHDYALALLETEHADEALTAIERSIKHGEGAASQCARGMILTSLGRAAEAVEAYDRSLELEPAQALASYNALFVRTLKETAPEDNHAARKRWHETHRWKGEKRPHANDRTPDRPLRVGYVGGDFKMHSAAFIFGTVVLNHDRAVVEPYCYMSMTPDAAADGYTKRFAEGTTFRDISAKSDDEAEAMIRADQIDVLVDLAGHTGGNRLPLFTRKPAPVQVHAWGFAHGSGCPEIDWFIADPYAVPEEERKHFAEKIWDLPAIVGFTPPDYGQPGVSPPPVSRDGVFTFGVFGRFEKHSPQSLEAWHKILLRTPGSRLLIKDAMMRRPYVVRRVREVMHDVDPKRILFAQDTSHPEQMLAYQGVDLVLDTFPHTGGVTSLEILHMGVPVVTLYNGQVGGRTTAVALKAIGRKSWIATTIDEYVRKAVKLAEERAEVAKARQTLRAELAASPLSGERYARAAESAYRQMWWRYCGHDADHSRNAGRAARGSGAGDGGVG